MDDDLSNKSRSRHLARIMARKGKVHPLVHMIDMEIYKRDLNIMSVCIKAGVGVNTINQWGRCNIPTITTLSSVLGVLGYRLTIEKITDKKDE